MRRADLYEAACNVEDFLRRVTGWEGTAEDQQTEAIEEAEKLVAVFEENTPQVVPLSEVKEPLELIRAACQEVAHEVEDPTQAVAEIDAIARKALAAFPSDSEEDR